MVRLLLAALCFVSAATATAAPVYKCVDDDGKTTFSGRPCSSDAEVLTVKDNRIGGSFSPSDEWLETNEVNSKAREINRRYDAALRNIERGTCRSFSSTELRSMIIANGVTVGMTVSDATRAWGAPSAVNGNGWQHAYHWPGGGSSYFYVRDGCVTSVQGSYGG